MNKIDKKTITDVSATLNTNGWLIIEELLKTELTELADINNIDDTQPTDVQAAHLKGRKEAHRIIRNVLSQIKNMAQAREQLKREYL